jgi:hypothetical protein
VELKAVDLANEFTLFIDTGGTTTSTYRHRGSNLAESSFTDWSAPILYGDYLVRQQIVRDCSVVGVVPSGIDNDDWDTWRDETIMDMQLKGLGRQLGPVEFSYTAGADSWEDIPSDIRRITLVEIWRSSTDYWTSVRGWDQRGRKLRIYKPLGTPYAYQVYGVGELRDMNDMDDELGQVLYWGMRWKYILKRQVERADSRPYMGRTRTGDSPSNPNYQQLADAAYAKYIERVYDALKNEGSPSGEGGR